MSVQVAQAERASACMAVEHLEAEHAQLRAAFLGAPTPEADAAVEEVERRLRSAVRMNEAMAFQLQQAEAHAAEQAREQARSELDSAIAAREALRCSIGNRFDELTAIAHAAAIKIAEIENLVLSDVDLCERLNDAASRAGEEGHAQPLNLGTVRLAIGVRLADDRPHASQAALTSAVSLLGHAAPSVLYPKSAADIESVIHLALHELGSDSRWITPVSAPPHWLPPSVAATYERARTMLTALEREPK